MVKAKQSKNGKSRNETRDERRARVKEQVQARETYMKMLPFSGGVLMVLILMIGTYMNNIPTLQIIPGVAAQNAPPKKDFKLPEIPLSEEQLKLKNNPKVKAALEQAARELQESLKKHLAKKKAEEAAAKLAEEKAAEGSEEGEL